MYALCNKCETVSLFKKMQNMEQGNYVTIHLNTKAATVTSLLT